jgi:putative flippase GtrA
MKNILKHQLASFTGVGIFSLGIDALSYAFMINFTSLGMNFSKGASFFLGTLNSYFFNRSITFRSSIHHASGLSKHLSVYGFSAASNIFMNNFIFQALESIGFPYAILFGFLSATAISVIINFIGLKFFVFKS